MLVPMAKVQIVGPRAEWRAVLAVVHRLGVLEIAPIAVSGPVEMVTIRPAETDGERMARVESAIKRLNALLERLPASSSPLDSSAVEPDAAQGPHSSDVPLEVEEWLAGIEPPVASLASVENALQAEASNLRQYRDLMERLMPLAGSLVPLEGFDTVALIIEPTFGYLLPALRDELATITSQCELVAAESPDGSIAALVVFSRRFAGDVHRLLETQRLSEVRLPSMYWGRPFDEAIEEIAQRERELPGGLAAVRDRMTGILAPHRDQMFVRRTLLLDELDELLAAGQCLESDHTFAFAGWVPVRDLPALEEALKKSFGQRVVVERLLVGREEHADVPVLLDNPPLFRPFEVLLKLLPLPRYGTLDPTVFVSFFFPFFFGFVLGDIGYGLILLAGAFWVQRRWRGVPWVREASRIALLSATAAMAFGVAFGEFFGDLGQEFGLRPLVVDRANALEPLLLFSVGLGAVQVGLGLVLGAVNAFFERRGKEVLARAATLIGLSAVFALVAAIAGLLPPGVFTPTLALLAAVTAVLIYSVGVSGPLELLGVIGNVLSYTRLAAVGLASVALARVANEFAGLTGSVLVGVVIGGLFHALNLVLGLFSPSIQSLRLQYVEFFGRFYQAGGRPYRPFRCRFAGASAGPGLE